MGGGGQLPLEGCEQAPRFGPEQTVQCNLNRVQACFCSMDHLEEVRRCINLFYPDNLELNKIQRFLMPARKKKKAAGGSIGAAS